MGAWALVLKEVQLDWVIVAVCKFSRNFLTREREGEEGGEGERKAR